MRFLYSLKTGTPQPLCIGDSRGILYVTEYRKQEPEIKVKTPPFSREITCVDLNQNVNKERIYFSFGNSIFISNRSFKDYSKIEFDLADNIQTFKATDNMIWTASNNYLSKYEYGEATLEKGTYDNETAVSALCLTEIFGKSNPMAIIGSEESKLKLVSGKDLVFSVPVSSAPTSISQYKSSFHDLSEDNYLFGTNTGSHGLLNVNKESMKVLWEMNQDKNMGEVVAIKTFDINFDGVNEILLIRSNGEFSVYSTGKTLMDVSLTSRYETNEVLTGVDVGKFRTEEESEIMFSSYSGLLFSLTPKLDLPGKTLIVDKKTLSKNLKEVQNEVEILKQLYDRRLAEFQKQQNNLMNPISKNPFKVNHKMNLLSKEAVYNLKIESEFPIEFIIIQSPGVSLDILEIISKDVNLNVIKDRNKGQVKGGLNVALKSNLNVNENSCFLATLKFKESVHQLEMLLRTYENISDEVNCTIVPYNKPKTAFTVEIPIKALSLHKKVEEIIELPNDIDENIINVLTIKGKFQTSEMNQILSEIIPDIPEKTNKDCLKFIVKSTFLNTFVEITIDSGVCRIRSVYLSPLTIIKEQVTKVANNRKKDMEFNIQIKTLSIFHILELVDPMIQENFNLEIDYKIIQAFKEIDISESRGNILNLPEEYQVILNNSESIKKKYEQRTINLHYLQILVENLLKDVSKVRSISNLSEKVKDVASVFEDYSFDKLLEIFKELKNI